MAKRFVIISTAALALCAGPALATPCADRLAAAEALLDGQAEEAVSVSTAGQGVAAARESQGGAGDAPPSPGDSPAVPFQDPAREAAANQEAAEIGGGGDAVMQATAVLNQAREKEQAGDAAACAELVDQAERLLADPE